jgi:hypothetical protein
MVLEFPRRDPRQLFFPLVHVHNGRVDERAALDHRLYCQDVSAARLNRWPPAEHWGWETSDRPLAELVDLKRTAGVLRSDRPCHRVVVRGTYPNVDLLV